MLELYHGEPNGVFLKPLIALYEKKVAFTSRYFDPLSFAHYEEGFPHNAESQLHLEREGPVLVHDGEVISSSYFMLEYIAEAFPGVNLLPGDAWAHYRSRALGQVLALGVNAAVSALGCAKYLAPALKNRDQGELRAQIARIEPVERRTAWLAVIDGTCTADALAAARERLRAPVARVEESLSQSQWITGEDYSIADIDAFAILAPTPTLAPEVVSEERTPRLMEFLQRMRLRPAVQSALSLTRTGRPQDAFVPGPEFSRWG